MLQKAVANKALDWFSQCEDKINRLSDHLHFSTNIYDKSRKSRMEVISLNLILKINESDVLNYAFNTGLGI